MVTLVLIDGRPPVWGDIGLGAAAGSVGLIGIVLLYRGLANGTMSVVAPITAVGAGVVPFAWGVVTGERPSAVALVGVAAALLAVALVSAAEVVDDIRATRADISAALLAGGAFGVVFILLGSTHSASGMWPVLAARIASVTLMTTGMLVARRPIRPVPGTWRVVGVAGILDVTA